MRVTWDMPLSRPRWAVGAGLLVVLICLSHRDAAAQKKSGQEFTRQGLLIADFASGTGADARLGRRVADRVRSRTFKLSNHRELDVVDGDEIDYQLTRAGYPEDHLLNPAEVRILGRQLRADEYVVGRVERSPTGYRVVGLLTLMRDIRLRQALTVEAPKADSAAELFARELVAARTQLGLERRCENALHEGKGHDAIDAAREGIAGYPRSVIARTCLLWALRGIGAPPTEVLTVAREILALDSASAHALEGAALALDHLHQREEAGDLWLRLAATDTADVELAQRVAYSMFEGGNGKRAEPMLIRVSEAHPDHIPLLWQRWNLTFENRSWPQAIDAGEALLARDSAALANPQTFERLATAYRLANRPYKSVEIAARGVSLFPNDARMYALYSQFVRSEADTVIPRGLAMFPDNAELLALEAKDLRSHGKLAEALAAQKRAVAIDSTLTQGDLLVAQTLLDLGQPDDALVSLHQALAHGEDSSLVAGFALARGNALYRTASGTHTSTGFTTALRYLGFADTLRVSPQSRFLVGAAALGVVQTALAEAPKLADRGRSCALARRSSELTPIARAGLSDGKEVAPEGARDFLEYLGPLEPYVTRETAAFCPDSARSPVADSAPKKTP